MKQYKMGDYCTGEPESIFINKVDATTGNSYSRYKEEFFRWALQQSKEELNEWYKEASKEAMGCQGERSHAECDFGYLKEALEEFSSYEQYHESILNDLLQAAKEYVQDNILFEDTQINSNDSLRIYPLLSLTERTRRLLREVEEGAKASIKEELDTISERINIISEKLLKMLSSRYNYKIMDSNEYKRLNEENYELSKARMSILKKQAAEEELKEIFSILEQGIDTRTFLLIEQIHYDSEIKRKYMLSKIFKNKHKSKELKEKFNKIDFLYKVASEAGTRRDDIYKKLKRLDGSGWSKQK